MKSTIQIGVSSCLLGNPVRYDGGHKRDDYIATTLAKYVEYIVVCPECEAGFGVPRKPLRLVSGASFPRFVVRETGEDKTEQMNSWIERKLNELSKIKLCGFLLKSKSPSCGMERVKIYNEKGAVAASGSGMFGSALMSRFPFLPVEEEGRLHDEALREHFIVRIFSYRRWLDLLDAGTTPARIVEFHARHKYLLMAHNPSIMRKLGALTARVKDYTPSEFSGLYETLFMEALHTKATVKKHVNVLQHLAGYFKKALTPDERAELSSLIDEYRNGLVPILAPLTLIKHYIRKYSVEYLANQCYLNPHPAELLLRNHP
jgi:uncharacterized protein YbgA (DUF1722 family)/uncharacterized protein YbbK (DUF523 family)